jgi:hypothetical protein
VAGSTSKCINFYNYALQSKSHRQGHIKHPSETEPYPNNASLPVVRIQDPVFYTLCIRNYFPVTVHFFRSVSKSAKTIYGSESEKNEFGSTTLPYTELKGRFNFVSFFSCRIRDKIPLGSGIKKCFESGSGIQHPGSATLGSPTL